MRIQSLRWFLVFGGASLAAFACDSAQLADPDDDNARGGQDGLDGADLDDFSDEGMGGRATTCNGFSESTGSLPVALNGSAWGDAEGGAGGEGGGAASRSCGCDGTRYASSPPSDVPLDPYDYCFLPSGTFGCGDQACILGEQYCLGGSAHFALGHIGAFECWNLGECPQELSDEGHPCGCLDDSCIAVPLEGSEALYHRYVVGR